MQIGIKYFIQVHTRLQTVDCHFFFTEAKKGFFKPAQSNFFSVC